MKNWKKKRIYMDDNLNPIIFNFHYFDWYIWKWKKNINYNADDMTSNEDDLKIVILEQLAN